MAPTRPTVCGICGWSSGPFSASGLSGQLLPRSYPPSAKPLSNPPARGRPTEKPALTARPGGKLPLERLEQIQEAGVREAKLGVAAKDLWCGHRVRVVDATGLTLPDTPENQQAFPQQKSQKPGCGFPLITVSLAFFSLATGLLTSWVKGCWTQSEIFLLQSLWRELRAGDVLLGDRGFSGWAVLAQSLSSRHSWRFPSSGQAPERFPTGPAALQR